MQLSSQSLNTQDLSVCHLAYCSCWTSCCLPFWTCGGGSKGHLLSPGMHIVSRATGTAPVLGSRGNVWFRGHKISTIPASYRDPTSCSVTLPSKSPNGLEWLADFTFPISWDGTRFLICDERGLPVVVDLSGLVGSYLAMRSNHWFRGFGHCRK
jgi:hypothetical protein